MPVPVLVLPAPVLPVPAAAEAGAEAAWRGRQAGVGGVSVAVAQAMRYAGCPNRRSLGVSDVFPREVRVARAPTQRFPCL